MPDAPPSQVRRLPIVSVSPVTDLTDPAFVLEQAPGLPNLPTGDLADQHEDVPLEAEESESEVPAPSRPCILGGCPFGF